MDRVAKILVFGFWNQLYFVIYHIRVCIKIARIYNDRKREFDFSDWLGYIPENQDFLDTQSITTVVFTHQSWNDKHWITYLWLPRYYKITYILRALTEKKTISPPKDVIFLKLQKKTHSILFHSFFNCISHHNIVIINCSLSVFLI